MPDSHHQRPRIAIAGLLHESNTFASTKTGFDDFVKGSLTRGSAILDEWAASKHEVGGFIEGAERFDFELYPAMVGTATPSGIVTDEAYDRLTTEMVERLREAPKFDALLLALHGAMVVESHPHADAETLRRLRCALGSELPIVVTHDFHGNIPEDVIRHSTALVVYQTCPHVDQRARGLKAAGIAASVVRGQVRPTQAIAKPPMLLNIRFHNTSQEPMRQFVEESRKLEEQPGILAVSVAAGYQYADVPQMGPSVVVVTDNDAPRAQAEAKRLSDMLWDIRERLVLDLPDAAGAVRQAIEGDAFPAVVVEMGDNIGGGSAGDSTFILAELLRQKAEGWVVAITDPEAVAVAVSSGVGQPFECMVGGKTDRLHGDPVRIRGSVKSIHDGKFLETEVRHGGQRYFDQGLTAVVEAEGSTRDLPNLLMLTTRRQMPFSLHQLISCGIYPERQKILVVKAAVAFRAAYEPVAARIIEADTGGVTAVNPRRFTWKHVRRPLFGLD